MAGGKNDTDLVFPRGEEPEGGITEANAVTQPGWDPRDVGQASLPRLYGPGLGNPYGVSDFEGTSNVNDTIKHTLNRQRIAGAIQMKGEDVDPAQFYGPQAEKTK